MEISQKNFPSFVGNINAIKEYLLSDHCQFDRVRQLEDGEFVGILQLYYTWSVCCGIEEFTPYKYRWCFKDKNEAIEFFNIIKDYDDIPIKRNSLKGHRYGGRKPLLLENDEKGFPKW